jgi:hypothetical protein
MATAFCDSLTSQVRPVTSWLPLIYLHAIVPDALEFIRPMSLEMQNQKDQVSSNSLAVACQFFGTDASENLYAAASKASPKKLRRFLEHYGNAASKGVLDPPKLEPGALRPYLIADASEPWLWGNFSFGFSTFDDADRVWPAVDAIKHRLLYCHAVAVDDPLTIFFWRAGRGQISEQDVVEKRTNILNFINFLLHMKPMIERNVFSFVWEDHGSPSTKDTASIQDLFRKYAPGSAYHPELFPVPEFSNQEIDDFYQHAPKHYQTAFWRGPTSGLDANGTQRSTKDLGFLYTSSRTRMLGILDTFSRAPGRLSLYFPFRVDLSLMSAFLDNIRRSGSHEGQLPRVHDRDSRLLTQLVDLAVPGIATLPIEDIISIREGNAFTRWRNDLKAALQYASSIPPDLMDYDVESRSAVKEMLEPAKRKLEEEFAKSAFLAKVREASATMAAGSVGALAGYLVDPSVGALIGGITGSATDVATKLIRGWVAERQHGSRAARAALVGHYVALLS